MFRFFTTIGILLCSLSILAAPKIDRIEPTNWYVGMKDPSLQLMIYGQGIREAEVATNYDGVRIDSLVRLDSPNYLLVYLNLRDAKPGSMRLDFRLGKKKFHADYELLQREMAGDKRVGFSNADVLYMLLPDRFADGNPQNNQLKGMRDYVCDRSKPSLRHGGDLEGIRKHLDYFNQLGVTAIWFAPILENNSPDEQCRWSTYHGYATTDYYRVDPRFGTNDEYRQLCREAHQHGLKVVMDMIFNHCGSCHPWNIDVPSHDWFNNPNYGLQTSYKLTPVLDPYASDIDLAETVDGWFVSTMPDLNHRNPHVIRYLTQNSIWWIEYAGIDGIRMDTYPYADRMAMAGWMKTLDEEYPNFNVVGETWVTQPAYTASWQKDSRLSKVNSYLKTVMDFSFQEKLDSAKREETDAWWRGMNRIYNSFAYDYLYEKPENVMAFIENHDTNRFLENGKDTLALKQALALLLTIRRTPQLYYGTEILMNGTKEVEDGNVRRDFPGGFPDDKQDAFTQSGRTAEQNAMFQWLSRLLHWRQGNQCIIKGKQKQFIPHNGVYVISRQHNGKTVLLVLNGCTTERTFEAKRYAEVIGAATIAVDVPTGNRIDISRDIKLSPRQTLILEY